MLIEEEKSKTLGIDGPTGRPRPGYFLPEVIAGTALHKRATEARVMGMWIWNFDDVNDANWHRAIQIIGPRLRNLCRRRMIRGAVLSGYDFGGLFEPDALV